MIKGWTKLSRQSPPMPKRNNASIARKARAKAESDFATWLMMAKLGSFDDLPADAQEWLLSYRSRLEQIGEARATIATIRELYVSYYAQLGGEGEAPEPAGNPSPGQGKVVDLKVARRTGDTRVRATSTPARSLRSFWPLLIFAGMVAALAAAKFAFGA